MGAELCITIGGAAVDLLLTPRLFVYRGREGVTLEAADGDSLPAVMSLYADVLYCAALNWWELSGRDAETFPHRRMDFHVWAAENPEEFGRIVRQVVRLLSGKSLAELARERQEKKDAAEEELKKKSRCGWITTRWRRFLSGIAERLRRRPRGRR